MEILFLIPAFLFGGACGFAASLLMDRRKVEHMDPRLKEWDKYMKGKPSDPSV